MRALRRGSVAARPPSGAAGVRNVASAGQLTTALAACVPGDTINLAAGTYVGQFVATGKVATESQPVTVQGPRTAIVQTGSTGTGYGLYLDQCAYVQVKGITIRTSKKALMTDESNHCLIEDVEVYDIGEEGVHFRNYSSDNTIRLCDIHGTGVLTPGVGEATYVGTHPGGWVEAASRTGGDPDACDRNTVEDCTMSAFTAEACDIKEGTTGTVFRRNVCDGSAVAGENSGDSWLDVKGNDAQILDNTFTQTGGVFANGIELHENVTGWCLGNVFRRNTLDDPIGYGIYYASGVSASNLVYDDNTVSGTNTGLTNGAVISDSPYQGEIARGTTVASASTLVLTTAATVPAGRRVLLAVAVNNSARVVTATDSQGGTWTLDATADSVTAVGLRLLGRTLTADLPPGATITVDYGAATTLAVAVATQWAGLGALDVTAAGSGNGGASPAMTTAATATTAAASSVAVAAFGVSAGATVMTYAPGSGYTGGPTVTAVSGASTRDVYLEYRQLSATGAQTATATSNTNKTYAALVAVYPAV